MHFTVYNTLMGLEHWDELDSELIQSRSRNMASAQVVWSELSSEHWYSAPNDAKLV